MGGMVAKSERPSVSTRTAEFTPRELPLLEHQPQPHQPGPVPFTVNPTSRRIREALRRWFDEEL
ncbi:MAG TPA: hypothetical protein VEM76_15210 [Anaeromyxobacteraceae bacterium]|nr:hypothetical protein [Anaeromyxobacteraceae bacterium]